MTDEKIAEGIKLQKEIKGIQRHISELNEIDITAISKNSQYALRVVGNDFLFHPDFFDKEMADALLVNYLKNVTIKLDELEKKFTDL